VIGPQHAVKADVNFVGTPRTSRKWTNEILLPNLRIAAGRLSVISVKLPWHSVMVFMRLGTMSTRRW
jgi:hypothetical protein